MKRRFPKYLQHDHSPESIRFRLGSAQRQSFVRDMVYGAIDGAVTTFAIVAGVRGAELSKVTVIILGLSNILADGFSMAAGNYLATKAEVDEKNMIADFENFEIETNPEGEIEETRQILELKGFKGDILEHAVKLIINDRRKWIKLMLKEEYGLSEEDRSPSKAATVTFISFLCFGLIPLFPYIINIQEQFYWATVCTGLAFFTLGALKSKWSLESPWVSGLKTFFLGSLAASGAYLVGYLLKDINLN